MFVLRDDGLPIYFYTVDIREPRQMQDVRLIVIVYLIKLDTLGSAHGTTNTILVVVLFMKINKCHPSRILSLDNK